MVLSPYNKTGVPTERNLTRMKEKIKTPEKELKDEKIDSQSNAEFKKVVIRCSQN